MSLVPCFQAVSSHQCYEHTVEVLHFCILALEIINETFLLIKFGCKTYVIDDKDAQCTKVSYS